MEFKKVILDGYQNNDGDTVEIYEVDSDDFVNDEALVDIYRLMKEE